MAFDNRNGSQVNPDISGPKPMPMDIKPVPAPSSQGVPELPPSMTMKPPKRHVPIVPIIIAVTVSIVLIGGTVLVFVMTKGDKKEVAENNDTNQTEVDDGRVSPEDIDAANKEIDRNLSSINDSTDFRSDDLSVQTIGL